MLLHEPSPGLEMTTRARWKIPNEVRQERPNAALAASAELFRQLRPRALLRSLTATYNCVGRIVASRRAWVDPEHLLHILTDDGFRQLGGVQEADIGDVVVYRDSRGEVCHAAVVVRKNVLIAGEQEDPLVVLSKWGADGEYIHDMTDLPDLLRKPVDFWTDRKGG